MEIHFPKEYLNSLIFQEKFIKNSIIWKLNPSQNTEISVCLRYTPQKNDNDKELRSQNSATNFYNICLFEEFITKCQTLNKDFSSEFQSLKFLNLLDENRNESNFSDVEQIKQNTISNIQNLFQLSENREKTKIAIDKLFQNFAQKFIVDFTQNIQILLQKTKFYDVNKDNLLIHQTIPDFDLVLDHLSQINLRLKRNTDLIQIKKVETKFLMNIIGEKMQKISNLIKKKSDLILKNRMGMYESNLMIKEVSLQNISLRKELIEQKLSKNKRINLIDKNFTNKTTERNKIVEDIQRKVKKIKESKDEKFKEYLEKIKKIQKVINLRKEYLNKLNKI